MTKKTLVAIPAVVAVVGLVLLIVGFASGGGGAKVSAFSTGARVTSDAGFSIYSTDKSSRTATVCRAVSDGTTSTMGRPSSDFSVKSNGGTYWEVARSTDGMTKGDYTVNCAGGNNLFAGTRADKIGGGVRAPGIVLGLILLIGGLLGVVLLSLMGRRKTALGGPQGQYAGYQQGSSYGAGVRRSRCVRFVVRPAGSAGRLRSARAPGWIWSAAGAAGRVQPAARAGRRWVWPAG